jgi:hypothetical protein
VCGTPTLRDLSLRENVPIVVGAKARESAVGWVALKVTVDPWILLVIGIKLHSITTGNGVGVLNSRHANLSLRRNSTEKGDGKGKDE